MSGKELKGGDGRTSWARALFEKFKGSRSSGSTLDIPPSYGAIEDTTLESGTGLTFSDKAPPTSPARIMGVDEHGRELGYISPAYETASWFNFQPVEEALIFDVPIINSSVSRKSGSKGSPQVFRLRMRNPTAEAAAGNFHFLGVQVELTKSTPNEAWHMAACDEGKPGPLFMDRARMLRTTINAACEGEGPIGNPACSRVWSIHAIEGGYEELRLSWVDKGGVIVPLKVTSEKNPKEGDPHHIWPRRQAFYLTTQMPVRLIVERCSEP
ncbi:hypothetical protein FRB95_006269 [Tulasnella sp. JGI-2019a]|nr:hypothetical protein FRB95_006269 [Tulasnella sp. JGI-2019a]